MSLRRPAIIRPVILCGGAGTRLWPLSRETFPKQFLSLFGDGSLLQQTVTRLAGERFSPPLIVSGDRQSELVRQQLEAIDAAPEAILLEPEGRNTAAAAALAAQWLVRSGRDELMLLVPSDHVIGDRDAFVAAVECGASSAEQGAIVTFGAEPTEPNTQYGYIEAATDGKDDAPFAIVRFIEKPDAATAAEYLASGRFFWNAGIFLVKASTLLAELRRLLPSSLDAIESAIASSSREGPFVRPEPKAFSGAQNISIDHGVMEKTSLGVVVPVQMSWSDVGSWDAVWKLGEKDEHGNVTHGNVTARDSTDCLLRSEGGRKIAAIGLNRMAVIAVADAVFVAPLDRVSEVKNVIEALDSCDQPKADPR